MVTSKIILQYFTHKYNFAATFCTVIRVRSMRNSNFFFLRNSPLLLYWLIALEHYARIALEIEGQMNCQHHQDFRTIFSLLGVKPQYRRFEWNNSLNHFTLLCFFPLGDTPVRRWVDMSVKEWARTLLEPEPRFSMAIILSLGH